MVLVAAGSPSEVHTHCLVAMRKQWGGLACSSAVVRHEPGHSDIRNQSAIW